MTLGRVAACGLALRPGAFAQLQGVHALFRGRTYSSHCLQPSASPGNLAAWAALTPYFQAR